MCNKIGERRYSVLVIVTCTHVNDYLLSTWSHFCWVNYVNLTSAAGFCTFLCENWCIYNIFTCTYVYYMFYWSNQYGKSHIYLYILLVVRLEYQ